MNILLFTLKLRIQAAILFGLLTIVGFVDAQPIYLSTGGKCIFSSATAVENISAFSESVSAIINSQTKEVQFKVPMTTFVFKRALMREHFNKKYVESDKFPFATFKGIMNEDIDFSKDGVFEVTATGILTIHGIDKQVTEKGTITIKTGKFNISNEFKVSLKDFHITIPRIVIANVSEFINIKLDCAFNPYTKTKP